jgi:pre-mRNA-splicing factor RBM22/SLT11
MSKNEGTQKWEESDFPILCSSCLGPNPALRMTRQSFGQACKVCSKPHTLFRWAPGSGLKFRRTEICGLCAKLKGVCQSCMLDLKYGLPVQVRDAVLGIKEAVPRQEVNREYYMALHAQRLAKGTASFGLIDYEGVDPVGKAILSDLAEKVKAGAFQDPALAKRNLAPVCTFYAKGTCNRGEACPFRHELSTESVQSAKSYHARYYGEDDWVANRMMETLVPGAKEERSRVSDSNATALQISRSALSDAQLEAYFGGFGRVARVIRSGGGDAAGIIEFASRADAEAAAHACLGQISIEGVPVRISWAKVRKSGGKGGDRPGGQHKEVEGEQQPVGPKEEEEPASPVKRTVPEARPAEASAEPAENAAAPKRKRKRSVG